MTDLRVIKKRCESLKWEELEMILAYVDLDQRMVTYESIRSNYGDFLELSIISTDQYGFISNEILSELLDIKDIVFCQWRIFETYDERIKCIEEFIYNPLATDIEA